MISAAGPNQLGGVSFLSPPIVLALAISPPSHHGKYRGCVKSNRHTLVFVGGLYFFIPKILLLLLHSIF